MTPEVALLAMREARPVIYSDGGFVQEVGVITDFPAGGAYAQVLFLGDRTAKSTPIRQLTPVPVEWLRYVVEGSKVTP